MSQQLLLTLKSLYAVNGVVGVSLYIPQILRAWRDKEQARSLSMVTFGGWSIGSLITVLYAWYFSHDLLFAALSLANMVAAGSLFLLILHTRLSSQRRSAHVLFDWVNRPPFRNQELDVPLQIFVSSPLCTIR